MICRSCGIENNDDAATCVHCGMKFQRGEPASHGRACSNCGFENPHHSKFCARCGVDLRHHAHGKELQRPKGQRKVKKNSMFERVLKWHPAAVTLALLGVMFVLVVGLQMWQSTRTPPEAVLVRELKSSDPKLEASVLAIASRFICSCGSCGEKPLDTCACERAIEERQFIRNYLQGGQSVEQVIAAVDQTYGWKKTDSTSANGSLSVGSLKVGTISLPSQLATPLTDISAKWSGNDRVATAVDKFEVFSHFRCPCGVCGMDDLNSCTCQHPNGAFEIKAFVDGRIALKSLTIAQIIKEVDTKFGGRKN